MHVLMKTEEQGWVVWFSLCYCHQSSLSYEAPKLRDSSNNFNESTPLDPLQWSRGSRGVRNRLQKKNGHAAKLKVSGDFGKVPKVPGQQKQKGQTSTVMRGRRISAKSYTGWIMNISRWGEKKKSQSLLKHGGYSHFNTSVALNVAAGYFVQL